ncbi:MAG TPA: hypothetical protein VFX61_05515 [Micromonosporaceae bacterium]|nr:hypothetical protein [Micromonosporaceae bacterium]
MRKIVEIVPARPGWYARWRPAPDSTRACPVAVWVLMEGSDGANREVIGIDTEGQWPGADRDQADAEFVRYLFQPPESGQPDDACGPVPDPCQRVTTASWL